MQENVTLKAAVAKSQAGAAAMKQAIQQIRDDQAMTEASAGQLLAAIDSDKAHVRAAMIERRHSSHSAAPDVMGVVQHLYLGALLCGCIRAFE